MKTKVKSEAATHVERVSCIEFELAVVSIEHSQLELGSFGRTSVGQHVDMLIDEATQQNKMLQTLTINLTGMQHHGTLNTSW